MIESRDIKLSFISISLAIISFLVVFLVPFGYHIDLGPGANTLTAVFWDYSVEYNFRFFVALRYYLEFYIFRIVVLISIILYLVNKFSKKWLILIAIIAELIPLILSIPASMILNSDGDNLFPIIVPIPILLFYVILIANFLKKKYKKASLT